MSRMRAYGHEHLPEQVGVLHGFVNVTPTANTPTAQHVTFSQAFAEEPTVVVSAVSAVPGSAVQAVSAANITNTGFDAYVYRTNSTVTAVMWIAVGKLA